MSRFAAPTSRVSLRIGVNDGVGETLGVKVDVGANVAVGVPVAVTVAVGTGVAVLVTVAVFGGTLCVAVTVRVAVDAAVAVGMDVCVAVGADGVMVEVHPRPDEALSDAEQQLNLDQFREMMPSLVAVHEHVRSLHGDPIVTGAALGIGGNGGNGGLGRH